MKERATATNTDLVVKEREHDSHTLAVTQGIGPTAKEKALLHSRQIRQLRKEGPHAPYTPTGTKEELPSIKTQI
jgi:hypothetical protein